MEKSSDKRDPDQMNQDPGNYKFGFLYWNKYDKRIIVPKRTPFLGWTINFGNPYSYVFLILFIVIIYLLQSTLLKN